MVMMSPSSTFFFFFFFGSNADDEHQGLTFPLPINNGHSASIPTPNPQANIT